MTHSFFTETQAGIYRHLQAGSRRYPIAVEGRNGRLVPVRDADGNLLYATPGGGRMTAPQILAAA